MQIPVDKTGVLQVLWAYDGSTPAPESLPLWCSYTGQTEEVEQPWGWLAAVHTDDWERVRQRWEEAVANTRMFTIQYRLRAINGAEHTIHVTYAPLLTAEGIADAWISWLSEDTQAVFPPESLAQLDAFTPGLVSEQAPLGLACLSLDRYLLKVNEQFCAIMGYHRTDIIGQRVHKFLSPDIWAVTNLITRQMLLGKMQRYVYELEYPRPDGASRWLKVTIALLRHAQNIPLYFFTWIEDISAQRQIEQGQIVLSAREQAARTAAQQAREQATSLSNTLQTVFRSITDGIIIYDRKGVVLQINEAARTLLKLGSETDCLGKTFVELFGDYELYDEARRPIPLEKVPIIRLSQGQTVSKIRIEDLHLRFPSGDEYYLDLTSTPLQDQQGHTTGLVSVFRDITERHHKEHHIRQAFHALSHLMEDIVHLPLQIDPQATEKHFISASLPVVGQHLSEVIHQVLDCSMVGLAAVENPTGRMHLAGLSGFAAELVAKVQQDMERSTLSDYLDAESIMRLSANQVVLRDLVAQPFIRRPVYGMQNFLLAPMLLNEQLVGIFGIERPAKRGYTQEEIDLVKAIAKLATLVIERARLLHIWAQTHTNELALQEINHRFDAFLSLASHELRTPLTGIRGSIQLVLRRLDKMTREETASLLTSSTMYRLRHPLEEAIQRVSAQDRMIGDLLDVSRIRADRLEMVIRPCNLVEIVRHAIKDIQYLAPDRSIEIHYPGAEVIPIAADADRMGQVVSNYLSNALKYSTPGRAVQLWLTSEGTTVQVSVKDEGPGLDHEEQQSVWERFYRVKGVETLHGTGAGLGLGLYLCRTIIEQHGGQVGVNSSKGKGSTFWFTLPLAPEL